MPAWRCGGPPPPFFTEQITGLAKTHKNLRCALGAHSHVNTRLRGHGVEFVTVSSLIESCFEVKLFEISAEGLGMTTIPLAPELDFEFEYDKDRSFVQGRPGDRSFGGSSA